MPVSARVVFAFFFSSRRRHTRSLCDWSSDVCSSDLLHRVTDHIAVINRTLAQRYFPNGDAIGHSVKLPKIEDRPPSILSASRSEERRVGKGVDLGGRSIMEQKKQGKEKVIGQQQTIS